MLASILLLAFVLNSPAAQQKAAPVAAAVQLRPLSDEAVRRNQRLVPKLSPSAKSKVQSAAAALSAATKQQPQMTQAQLQSKARAEVVAAFPGLAGTDIDTVAFLILMQAAQDQESELQQAMNAAQKATASKQAARGAQKQSADQLSDMDTNLQMQLQMTMDRRSKFLEALSNVEKSISATQDTIVQNLK